MHTGRKWTVEEMNGTIVTISNSDDECMQLDRPLIINIR